MVIDADNGRMILTFDKVEIHRALKELFKYFKIDYVIRSDVESDTVTAVFAGRPLDTMLQQILRSVKQPLTYRVEGDIYTVTPKEN